MLNVDFFSLGVITHGPKNETEVSCLPHEEEHPPTKTQTFLLEFVKDEHTGFATYNHQPSTHLTLYSKMISLRFFLF